MKKILFIAVTVISFALFFNSCQKELDQKQINNNEEVSISKKVESGSIESATDLPDLIIDAVRLQSSMIFRSKIFKAGDCAVSELCVNGTGKRKLLRFDVATPNIGTADLVLGSPVGNPLFVLSTCHGHYHFSGYANYELLNANGTTVLTGHKQAFCLLDYSRVDPAAGPAKYTCSNQGISVGWQDVYGSYLDCQWLDITGITAGNYSLRVSINPEGKLAESNYGNNTATVHVKISK